MITHLIEKNNFQNEVDPEMVIEIKDDWSSLEDYISDLKKKYRKKYRKF